MYSFCAMYSFRMSFCSVPEIFFQSAPCFSATARYMAQMTAAGELMVIEVVTSASGIWSKSTSISASELMATPHLPDFAFGKRMVGVVAHQRGQIERDGKSGLPLRKQIAKALRWCLRPCRSRRIAAWSTGGRDTSWDECRACREARPGRPRSRSAFQSAQIGWGIKAANRIAGDGGEFCGALGGFFERGR